MWEYTHVAETMKNAYVLDHFSSFVALRDGLEALPEDAKENDFQTLFYEVGKQGDFESLREWFLVCYFVFLSKFEGPRLGQITAMLRERFTDELNYRIGVVKLYV